MSFALEQFEDPRSTIDARDDKTSRQSARPSALGSARARRWRGARMGAQRLIGGFSATSPESLGPGRAGGKEQLDGWRAGGASPTSRPRSCPRSRGAWRIRGPGRHHRALRLGAFVSRSVAPLFQRHQRAHPASRCGKPSGGRGRCRPSVRPADWPAVLQWAGFTALPAQPGKRLLGARHLCPATACCVKPLQRRCGSEFSDCRWSRPTATGSRSIRARQTRGSCCVSIAFPARRDQPQRSRSSDRRDRPHLSHPSSRARCSSSAAT